jgi:hypothetical protein
MKVRTLLAAGIGALALPLLAQAGSEAGPLALARLSISGAAIAAAAVYDLRERRVPNRLTLPAATLCLTLQWLVGAASPISPSGSSSSLR